MSATKHAHYLSLPLFMCLPIFLSNLVKPQVLELSYEFKGFVKD